MSSLHNIIKLRPLPTASPLSFRSPFLCIFAVFQGKTKKKKSSSNLYILYTSKQNVKVRVFLNTFYPLYPKVLQALKSFPNNAGVFSTVKQVGLVIPGSMWVVLSVCLCRSLRLARPLTGRC